MGNITECLLDGIEDGICVFNGTSGLVMHMNAAFRALSGLSSLDDGPVYWTSWLSSQNNNVLSALERAIANRRRQTVVVARTTGACSPDQLLVRVTPVDHGSVYMMTVKVVDVPAPKASLAPVAAQPGFSSATQGSNTCLPFTAESLMHSSPQPMCIVGVPGTPRVPSAPSTTHATPQPQGLSAATAAAVADTFSRPHSVSRAGSCASCLECCAEEGFQWTAYAMLPGAEGSEGSAEHSRDHSTRQACTLAAPGSPSNRADVGEAPCIAAVAPADPHPDLDVGCILYGNNAMLQLCGYSQEQLRSGGLALLLRDPHGAAAVATASLAGAPRSLGDDVGQGSLQRLAAALSSGAPARMELPCYHSSGRRLWCSLAVSAVGPQTETEASTAYSQGWRRHASAGHSPRGGAAAAAAEGCGFGSLCGHAATWGTAAGPPPRIACEGGSSCTASAVTDANVNARSGNSSSTSSSCHRNDSRNFSGNSGKNISGSSSSSSSNSSSSDDSWVGIPTGCRRGSGSGDDAPTRGSCIGSAYGCRGASAPTAEGAGGNTVRGRAETNGGDKCGTGDGGLRPSPCRQDHPSGHASIAEGQTGVCDSAALGTFDQAPSRLLPPEAPLQGDQPGLQQCRRLSGAGEGPQRRGRIGQQQPQQQQQQQGEHQRNEIQQQQQQEQQPELQHQAQQRVHPEDHQELVLMPRIRTAAHNALRAHALGDLSHCQSPPAPAPPPQRQLQNQLNPRGSSTEQERQQQQEADCQEHCGQCGQRQTPRRCFLIVFQDVTPYQRHHGLTVEDNPTALSSQEQRTDRTEQRYQLPVRRPTAQKDEDFEHRNLEPSQPAAALTPHQGLLPQPQPFPGCCAAGSAPAAEAVPLSSLPSRGSLASLLAAAGSTSGAAAVGPGLPGAGGLAGAIAAAGAAGVCAACQLHDSALDSLREGITLADAASPDFPIVYINHAFLNMTGYTREEVLGRNCRFLQGPDTDPAAVQAIRDAIRGRQRLTVQLLNYTKAGVHFWNELRLAPVVSPASGKLVAYIGIQSDVTELVTRKQTEARLRDAKEAAESATEAKSHFLANMSHEIRTPLNGMIATAQLLLGSVLTPEQRELTETILESGSTLVGILGDILDFSKIDHGSLELQRRPMCLRQATEACVDLVAAEAAKKGLALAYLIDDEALAQPLVGDPVRIRQVLANLLSNAVKFTEKGEVVVRVSVEREQGKDEPATAAAAAAATTRDCTAGRWAAPAGADEYPDRHPGDLEGSAIALAATADVSDGTAAPPADPGSTVHIAVTDTGIGIDDASARKLFQHFRQGSETMSRRYGGTGLGLAISKRLAQLMHGDIWVESRQGAGSTFHFTLQAEWGPAAAGPWPCSPCRSAGSTPSQSSGCTPRTSTDEGENSGATVAGGPAAAALAASSLYMANCTTGSDPRLSNASSGSGRGGRELRTSPWLPDGTARDAAAGSSSEAGAAGEGPATVGGGLATAQPSVPASICGHRSSCGGASSSGARASTADSPEERAALTGRVVLVDVSHGATSSQVWNSCRQLGLSAVQGNACAVAVHSEAVAPTILPAAAASAATAACAARPCLPPKPPPPQLPAVCPLSAPSTATQAGLESPVPTPAACCSDATTPSAAAPGQAAGTSPAQQLPFDILIVSVDRLVPALKAGWKGRPVVALGDREQLPPALQPLVVALAVPVRHHRLATALVKATALLRWNGSSAPKLANTPIPNESIQTLKSWRLKRGPDWEGLNRRTSLDNSALERAVMARPSGTGGAVASGAALGKSGLGTERSPQRQQQVSIPEHAELSNIADDVAGSTFGQLQPSATAERAQPARSPAPAPMPTPPPTQAVHTPHTSQLPPCGSGVGAGMGAPRSAAPAATTDSNAGGNGMQNLERLRILIAEDNKVNQKVVLKVLQQILRGCQPPDVVENGLQVLQALQKKTYDLILMDIHMPEMDGLEASKRIQETYKPEDRPRIIALSADTVQTLHDRCREAGIEAFLVKPFRIEELARVMRTGTPRLRNRTVESDSCSPPLAV